METSNQTDAVSFLQTQHDTIRELLQSVADSSGDQRKKAFEPLVRLLAVHETAEEIVVYPAVEAEGGDEGKRVAEARKAEEDEAKKMLVDLEKLDAGSEEFNSLFARVRSAVESHAEAEERELFPLLQQVTDEQKLDRLGSALKVAEGIAPTHPHKFAPQSALGNLAVGPFVAVVDRVRDALRDVTK